MIAQNDRNKILHNFLTTFFPGRLEKMKIGKKRDFSTPKMPKKSKDFLNQSFLS